MTNMDAGLYQSDFRAGRVFNQTWSVLSRNLLPFCLVTAIASLPNVLIVATQTAGDPRAGSDYAVWLLLAVLAAMVLSALSEAVVLYGAFEDMRGRPVNLLESVRIGLRRFFPVLGVAVLVPILAALAGFLLIVPAFIVLTMLFVAMPACVVETLGPLKSMGRSAQLTKGHRWKIFGLWFATTVAGGIIQAALEGLSDYVGGAPLRLAVLLAWGALLGAFYAILVVVTYHDLRVTKEGVDTSQIAAVFD
ncbi:MAG: hypothetical protein J2P54_25335 [Bradyrhizobiaceae bacterium]|nr:hypothetical protein [Bradyrhizobiaceae bacterium]